MSLSRGSKEAVRPQEIVFNIKKIGGHFTHGHQECAHEFTRLFMDSLLRSSVHGKQKLDKYEEATTLPHRIFGGWFRSRVTCMNCKNNSDTYESFLDMPLEIKVRDYYMNNATTESIRIAKISITVSESSPEKKF